MIESCHEQIARVAARLPEKTAIVFEGSEISYAALEAKACAIAAALLAQGTVRGDVIPVLLPRGADVLAVMLGIWKMGAAPAFLNEEYPQERIDYILSECSAKLLLDRQWIESSLSGKQNAPSGFAACSLEPQDLGLVVFTSGSTGTPKGVMLSHRALAMAQRSGLTLLRENDVCLSCFAFSFVAFVGDVVAPLAAGATLHIASDATRKDVFLLAEYIERQGITTTSVPVPVARTFLEIAGGSLRALFTGSERVERVWSDKTNVICLYGASETAGPVTCFPIDKPYENTPVGKPGPGSNIYILDDEGKALPQGETGEICISGQIALGYLNSPELTAERFVPNPFRQGEDDAILFKTRDLGYMRPDGNLQYVQRKDWMLKVRGFRVEPGEIEAAIIRSASIDKAVVVGIHDDQGDTHLYGYYTAKEPVDPQTILDKISEFLPPYMVPASLMQIDHMPLNHNGKVDRKSLPAPDLTEAASVGDEAASGNVPRTEVELAIEEELIALLGPAPYGLSTNLVRMGLTSLSANKLVIQLDRRFGSAPPVQDILRTPTILGIENALVRSLLAERKSPVRQHSRPEESGREFPLSQSQAGVCFDCLKRPKSVAYNLPARLDLPVSIDAHRLARAVAAVLDAHPGVKARLVQRGESVVQVRDDASAMVHCRDMSAGEATAFASTFVRPFDLFSGPLYRVEVIRTPLATTLFMDIHHIVFDGGSFDIFLQELAEAYERDAPFGETRERLSSFAWAEIEEQREGGPEWLEDKAFFDALLTDFERASELAPDLPNPEGPGRFAEVAMPVDGAKAAAFCREHGLTQAALFLAAAGYAISRWTLSDRVFLATISNGRDDVRLHNTLGMFVRTLPLRLELGSGQSRADYVRAAGEMLAGAIAHQRYPFTRLAEEYGFIPSIMYAYEVGVISEQSLGGAPLELSMELSVPDPKFGLSIHVEERKGSPVFAVQYDNSRYSEDLMRRFTQTLCAAFAEMTDAPQAPLRSVSLLSSGQESELAAFIPEDEPVAVQVLHTMFENAARRYPERTALIAAEKTYTYAELNAEANRLANALLAKGVAPEDRVAFALHRTGRVLIAMLGILKAGCAYIPVDPEYPEERIAHVLADSKARFLLTLRSETDVADRVAGLPGVLDIDELREGKSDADPGLAVAPEWLAYLIYTSGSTGKPKGVMLEHRGIANYVTAHPRNPHVAALASDATAMLSITTVAFDMFLKESMTALCAGITLVFADDGQSKDPVLMADLFAATGADAFNTTPSRMMEYAAFPDLLRALRKCKVLMAGAENYPAALLSKLRGNGEFSGRLFNTYGPTEITVSCNCKELTGAERVTVGAPLLNVHEYIVDADGNLLPPGMSGELLVGGAGVARGYNNLPEQTAERFITYRGERVYKTGDLARWTREGEVVILGRNDDQIKLRGLRIELGEVAGALATLPFVTACAAAVRNIGGQDHLCVWYQADEPVAPESVREHLAALLPPYMLPSAYRQIAQMPKLPNGKNDVRSLPEACLLRLADYEAPANELEKAFCNIFATVLGLEEVGARDSFFEIGGSSLAVTRIIIEARQRGLVGDSGATVAYGDVFANPTPRDLAALLVGGDEKSTAPSKLDDIGEYHYEAIHALLAQGTLSAFREGERRPPGNVLLTGATGFLGSHVLHSLLRDEEQSSVCCLLRKGRYSSVEERLKAMLYYYFENTFEDLWGTRLFALEGDITDPALAKSPFTQPFQIDTIINCAANVSHFAKDSGISDVNLGGVKNLIALAQHSEARLVHISTASVAGFSIDGATPASTVLTEQLLYLGQNVENQYIQSKFLAERAILEAASAGLDAKIMRVGNLMARDRDGEFQINLHTNSFIGRLRAYCAIQCFPYSAYLRHTELAPIDSTARAVLLLAGAPGQCRVFHPFNNHQIYIGDIINVMRDEGMNIALVEDDEYARAMTDAMKDKSRAEHLVSLIAYQNVAQGRVARPIETSCDYTSQVLLRQGWQWPVTGDEYLRGFIRGLRGLGFFE